MGERKRGRKRKREEERERIMKSVMKRDEDKYRVDRICCLKL